VIATRIFDPNAIEWSLVVVPPPVPSVGERDCLRYSTLELVVAINLD
jgi:hypothetical protein